jgi:hypothetical protein
MVIPGERSAGCTAVSAAEELGRDGELMGNISSTSTNGLTGVIPMVREGSDVKA